MNARARWRSIQEPLAWLAIGTLAALVLARLSLKMAVVLFGGVALLITSLIWPEVVIPVLALAVPFGPALPLGGFAVGATDMLVGLLVGAWLVQGLAHRRFAWPRLPFLWPLLVYLAALGISLHSAWSLSAALPELVKWGEVLALYVVMRTLLDRARGLRDRAWSLRDGVVAALAIAATSEALLGLAQFFLRMGPPQFIILGRFLRAYGTFAQPNPYAGFLGLVLPLALSMSLDVLARHVQGGRLLWPERLEEVAELVFYPTATGIIFLGLLASWSRGGWLGMVAGVTAVIVLRSRRAAVISGLLAFLLVAAVVLGIVGALPTSVSERFQGVHENWTLFLRPVELRSIRVTGENFALVERMAHWWAAYAMWRDHPVTGVGVGNYPVAYETYRMPGWKAPLGHAHNILLNVMAETGLVGLAAYLLLWGWVFAYGLWALRHTRGKTRAILVGALGGLLHLTVHNLFDNLYVHGMYAYVAVLLAFIAEQEQIEN